MKTSKLVKNLSRFGEIKNVDSGSYLIDGNGNYICEIGTNKMFQFDINYEAFWELSLTDKRALFAILYDYATTLLDQREDEPRFIVHLYPGRAGFMYNPFVERNTDTNRETRFRDNGMEKLVTYFTLSEYEQIQDEADRAGFILPDYDAENTDVFVPAKDGDEE